MRQLALALIVRRGGDDTDPYEWIDALTEAQMRLDMTVLRALVEGFLLRK